MTAASMIILHQLQLTCWTAGLTTTNATQEKILYTATIIIQLGRINTPTPTYVVGFGESMLITLVGLDCTVRLRIATSYTIYLKVVDGINPYENSHTIVLSYVKVPLTVNRYEPSLSS